MPAWVNYLVPIITLILGMFLEIIREKVIKAEERNNEFLKQRFTSLLFPLYIYLSDYKSISLNDPVYYTNEYFIDKSNFAYNVLLKYSLYSSAELLSSYTHFSAELYDHIHIKSNIEAVKSEFESFSQKVTNEYIDLSGKILKPVKVKDIFDW